MIYLASYCSYEYSNKILCLFNSIKKFNDVELHLLTVDPLLYVNLRNKYKNLICYNSNVTKINFRTNFSQNLSIARLIFAKYLLFKKKLAHIHLIDSDIYFFSNPKYLKKYVQNSDVAFCDHDFSKKFENRYGKYNAGYIYLKKTINTKNFLNQYIALCKEKVDYTIYNKVKNNFADQSYLEVLKKKFRNILVIKNIGINLGPWNIKKYHISLRNNELFINNSKLIFYHFSGVKKIIWKIYSLGLRMHVHNKLKIKKYIYSKYISELNKINFNGYNIRLRKFRRIHLRGNLLKSLIEIIMKKDFLIYSKL